MPNIKKEIKEGILEYSQIPVGSGGYGSVYPGYFTPRGKANKQKIVVKALRKPTSQSVSEHQKTSKESFDNEVDKLRIANQCEKEEDKNFGIIRLLATCDGRQLGIGQKYCLVMPFFEMNLKDFQKYLDKKYESLDRVLLIIHKTIIAQLLISLEKLHKKKLAHRDIKPENILVAKIGPQDWDVLVVFADLGLTRVAKTKTTKQSNVGTPGYMAPELCNNKTGKFNNYKKVDVWALGVVIYEILSGKKFMSVKKQQKSQKKSQQKSQQESFVAFLMSANQTKFLKALEDMKKTMSELQRLDSKEKQFFQLIIGIMTEYNHQKRSSLEGILDCQRSIQDGYRALKAQHYHLNKYPSFVFDQIFTEYFNEYRLSIKAPIFFEDQQNVEKINEVSESSISPYTSYSDSCAENRASYSRENSYPSSYASNRDIPWAAIKGVNFFIFTEGTSSEEAYKQIKLFLTAK